MGSIPDVFFVWGGRSLVYVTYFGAMELKTAFYQFFWDDFLQPNQLKQMSDLCKTWCKTCEHDSGTKINDKVTYVAVKRKASEASSNHFNFLTST